MINIEEDLQDIPGNDWAK